jgi:hypothetical protein
MEVFLTQETKGELINKIQKERKIKELRRQE